MYKKERSFSCGHQVLKIRAAKGPILTPRPDFSSLQEIKNASTYRY